MSFLVEESARVPFEAAESEGRAAVSFPEVELGSFPIVVATWAGLAEASPAAELVRPVEMTAPRAEASSWEAMWGPPEEASLAEEWESQHSEEAKWAIPEEESREVKLE